MPKSASEKTVVVSCDEDSKALASARKAKLLVVNSEFILTGVLRQQVDVASHKM